MASLRHFRHETDDSGPVPAKGEIIIEPLLTHYDTLGLQPQAKAAEVKTAYRKLAREYHPDINPDPVAHERMAQINAAFEILSDPVRRMEYDQRLGNPIGWEPFESEGHKKPHAVQVEVLHRFRQHATPVYGVGFTPKTNRLVSSSFDNEIVWWDLDRGAPEIQTKLESGVVSAIQVVDEETVVAAGSTEHSLACWTLTGRRQHVWRHAPKEWIVCVSPSPDGQSLALGTVDRFVRVLRADNGNVRFSGSSHTESVTALAWSPDSRLLATGSADSCVKIWCGTTGRELHEFGSIRSAVSCMTFSPDSRWIAVACVDLSVKVFSLRDLSHQKTLHGHDLPVESMAFHPRGWLLGTASRDGRIGIWNVEKGVGHGQIEASHQPINCIAFSRSGLMMATGGLDKVLRVWRLSVPLPTAS